MQLKLLANFKLPAAPVSINKTIDIVKPVLPLKNLLCTLPFRVLYNLDFSNLFIVKFLFRYYAGILKETAVA